jgi:hypothetical protein
MPGYISSVSNNNQSKRKKMSSSSSSNNNNNNNKVNIDLLVKNCWIPHDDLKPVYAHYENCMICGKKPDDSYFVNGECYCNNDGGITKQDILICMKCLFNYDMLSNYAPRLIVGDKQENAIDEIFKTCESIVSNIKQNKTTTTSSISSTISVEGLNFIEVMKDVFRINPKTRYFFGDIQNIHAENKRFWRLRYEIYKKFGF